MNAIRLNKKILVTGPNGFIASRFIDKYRHKYRIHIFGGNTNKLSLPREHYDFVLHLGAEAGVRRSHENPELYYENNVDGFQAVLRYMWHMSGYGHTNLIYASSSSIYEWWKSPYATTKKINEELTKSSEYVKSHQALGLRFHTVYGPKSRPDMLFDKIVRGDKIDYITDHTRDYTHVDDVCDAIDVCMKNFDKISPFHTAIDVGNGDPVSIADVVKHYRPNEELPPVKEVTGEREHTKADPTVLINHGWRPRHNILTEDISDYATE